MRLTTLFISLSICAPLIFSQVTSRLDGNVVDPQGAAVLGAEVKVVNISTGQNFNTKSNERGYWVLPSMETGTYSVAVSLSGFKSATIDNVKLDTGVPATVNVTLELGAVTETVEVSGGAEVLQTAAATVADTIQGRQIHDLPFTSHNATELVVTQPGTQTTTIPRSSSVNGLPQSTINITLDGINIQDNRVKSTDAMFNWVQPRTEAIEEVTISTAAAGADSSGEGATQMKFVTRSGSNQFRGALYEQNRNQLFEANYYFNNINGLPRDHLNLNDYGGRVGGPIKKNKAFFFFAIEAFRIPQTFLVQNETVLTPSAASGVFTYLDASKNVQQINLYNLAKGAGFPATADPILAKTLALENQLTSAGGSLKSRIASNNDYNRNNFSFSPVAVNNRNFTTVRLDYNLTEKHHVELVWNYQTNLRLPDGINSTFPIFPGTGSVLGSSTLTGQGGPFFTGVIALRSALSSHLTNEARAGVEGGTTVFNPQFSTSLFSTWRGYQPIFGSATNNLYLTDPYTVTNTSHQNAPVKQVSDTLSWQLASHLLSFGGSFTQVNYFVGALGTQFLPQAAFSMATGDPANTGATSMFTTANFPGASPTQLSDAASLYALLTGRVSALNSSVVLGEQSKTYGQNLQVDRNQQREFAFFLQDSWRPLPGLTITYGLRYDKQLPFQNLNGLYTHVGLAGLYGISGVGHLFQPGVLDGSAPQYLQSDPGAQAYQSPNAFSPNIGLAYVVPKRSGPLGWLGGVVLRAGYGISTIREGQSTFTNVWAANQGRSLTTSIDPVNFPTQFGAPGSVLFSNATLPPSRSVATTPSYPIPVSNGQTVNDFNPNIKMAYVQSWNFGIQRELTRDTVIEVRYVGNHGTDLWRTLNLNEVNIFENGFLGQFQAAANNLAIARGAQAPGASPTNNFGNQHLPGQQDIPIISTALGTTNDQTTANQLVQGQAGALANAIANNATRMNNLIKAGFAPNLFVANPIFAAANMVTNGGNSTYNAGVVEVRRRLAAGLQMQASYAFAKSLTNEPLSANTSSFSTMRNLSLDKGPSAYDIRNAVKLNWVYELPFGTGRHFLANAPNKILRKTLEGWEVAGVARVQSGSPSLLTGGRNTFNGGDAGVVLHNISAGQLQSMMSIDKTTNSQGLGIVYYLPTSLVNNTLQAFQLTSGTPDPNAAYIAPASTPGALGYRIFLYGPWQEKWDVSLVKRTAIRESMSLEFRVQALNVFNFSNFLLPGVGSSSAAATIAINNAFGQTTNAFRDFNNTNDPGSRTLEFIARFNF